MEEEKASDNILTKSGSPLPAGVPINWGLITGPVPEPVFPVASLGSSLPPPQSSAVRALQTKVKSLTQRRARGRDRERLDAELNGPAGHISSEVFLRQRPRGRGLSLPAAGWRTGAAKDLSSSDEEEEVEVQVKLEIHSPPAEAKAERAGRGPEGEGSPSNEFTFETKSGEDAGETSPSPLHQEPSSSSSSSSSPSATSAPSTSTPSSSSSSSSTRRWAPPKGFWRVARPETLVLNGVGPVSTPATFPLRDYTQTESPAEPQQKTKPTEPAAGRSDAGLQEDESDAASSEFKHSDSVECYLDRCEQKEAEAADGQSRGMCSSDSWESMTSQSGGPKGGGAQDGGQKDGCPQDRGQQDGGAQDGGQKDGCPQDRGQQDGGAQDGGQKDGGAQVGGQQGGGPQGAPPPADEKLRVKERAYAKLRERQQNWREERGSEDASYAFDYKAAGAQDVLDGSDPVILAQELEPYLRSLLVLGDELPLSPRHEQAKRLLERARLKARSSHAKGDRPGRRSHSDQRATVKKQQSEPSSPTTVQKVVPTKDDPPTQTATGPLLVPAQTDSSPGEQGARPRRYGCSPTRVRFEDESEREAESRYLDRVRQRGRPGAPKSKNKDSNTDSSSSGSERGRSQRSVSMPPSQRQEEAGGSGETTTVFKEIIVLVKKCEACGSVVREPQPVVSPPDPVNAEPQQLGNPEDARGKVAPRGMPPNKPEPSTRPKAPLTVTFAGAFVLGENKESSTVWKSSGFGKLRRRSRKGESRLESGNGPYGPSWAQRRNSNPRNRVNLSRAVSFAPGSPISLEPSLLEASGGQREPPAPSLPIKSALKSSSRSRTAAGQSTVQGAEGGSQSGLDPLETRRESPVASAQGTPATSSPVPCIRPSTLRYSPARLPTDLPAGELWDAAADGAVLSGDGVSSSECRALRGVAMSRAEDLRAELLRAEHLKAEAIWEENSDGSRKLDGRPKLFLRRFFSSIGLNSVGRLVKGGRSSSMEQLSIPPAPRASSASPSPTRRPQPTIRIQRTPSLQSLHTVLPLAQLRKASSVQSLERRTERSTILGEVQLPYGLAPSPDSPRIELHRALSVEDVMVSRMVRPVGRVTQAFPDGTLLLELVRPPNGPFGFVISRGKGRPDTGVYVEKVGDGSGEGPYVGLLGVGDEILQVNGEAVAGLSLDHVTRLMTRESTASLRIMPARRGQR